MTRLGCTCMGVADPDQIGRNFDELCSIGCSDVLLAAVEFDLKYMPGKVDFFAAEARRRKLRAIAIPWGVLNLFGGGRSSQFLHDHPEGYQRDAAGALLPGGCYTNPACRDEVLRIFERFVEAGFEGFFLDEPTATECFCEHCRAQFAAWFPGADIERMDEQAARAFRSRQAMDYVRDVSARSKATHREVTIQCCLMPTDQSMWQPAGEIETLDDLGTDVYWANEDRDYAEATELVGQLGAICRSGGKAHHEWLQCWGVEAGREKFIRPLGEAILAGSPDALYAWALHGQVGTVEGCADPRRAWAEVCDLFRSVVGG